MRLISFIGILFFVACGNDSSNQNKMNESNYADSLKSPNETTIKSGNETKPVDVVGVENNVGIPPMDTVGQSAQKEILKNVNIETRVFKNNDINGYGYDILMDGKTYVHQPNIPALPGNNGFATEKQAKLVAELVMHKIRNNIMPPTVEVRELDSLGIK